MALSEFLGNRSRDGLRKLVDAIFLTFEDLVRSLNKDQS
jgi:hypothetical protein